MEAIIGAAILMTSLAGIVTSVALLWVKVIKPTLKFVKRSSEIADVVQKLPEWQESVDEVLRELKPNHGGSMKDKVTYIKAVLESHINNEDLHNKQR